MKSITQDVRYKQSVIKYSQKYGVTKAAIKFREHRKFKKQIKKASSSPK